MQGKGIIKVFSVLLILVSVYQLSFTWVTNNIENDAEDFAQNSAARLTTTDQDSISRYIKLKRRNFLDSIAYEKVFNLGFKEFTYQECKGLQLGLGLDLQGGMSVVLQVSVKEMIIAMSNESDDENFRKALDLADSRMKNSQENYVTLFGLAYNEIAPNSLLAPIFSSKEYKDKINYNSSNEEVLLLISQEAEGAIDRTFNILRTRIDKFGVTQPNISLQKSTGRIFVELPGVDNPARVRKLLQATAKLEFWKTYENREILGYLAKANEALRDLLSISDSTAKNIDSTNKNADANPNDLLIPDEEPNLDLSLDSNINNNDGLALLGEDADSVKDEEANFENFQNENPLFAVLNPAGQNTQQGFIPYDGSMIGLAQEKDKAKVMRYLSLPQVRSEFPRDIKFIWSAKPISENGNVYGLHAIKAGKNANKAPLEGDVIVDASQDIDQYGNVEVSMTMDAIGAREWKRMTKEAAGDPSDDKDNKSIAIVLDNLVYSSPNVNGEISGGRSSISGSFDIPEAKDLANILKAGKLPAPAQIIEEEIVGPSLGQESIDAGLKSLLSGLVLVLAFMLLYYSGGGIVANIALVFNLFLIVGVLSSLGATLTLPGIAGIVLTIGMSVDANVLIFERIKEELSKGKGLRLAILDGYKNSYSSILDANITTLLTAFVLAYFGSGPILGFATVLIIGIISSLFTAVLVTRVIVDRFTQNDKPMQFATKLTRSAFKNLNINFIGLRKITYVISAVMILTGIGSIFTKGLELGVDFKGGRTYVVRFNETVNTNDIRNELKAEFGDFPIVKTFGQDNQVKITTAYLIDDNRNETDSIVESKLFAGLQSHFGGISFEGFKNNYRMSSQKVGPTIADDIKTGAIMATIFSIIIIFIYLQIRFRKWQYGLGAVVALFHDVLFVLGIFSLFSRILPFSLEIDQAFIAAILTVIGYSINDTVVVFDRLREYLGLHSTMDTKSVFNLAINNTMSRTLITSITTLLVVVILFVFGGEVIRGFSFALLIGILVGTYSSIFIASPIVADLLKRKA